MKPSPAKRLILWALCALLVLPGPPARALSTSAAASLLMDGDSGRVLYGENIRQRRPIASVTKLMTGLVAVRSVPDLDVPVTVDPRAAGVEGSSMYLRAGEVLTLRQLLYGLLLVSGNDAAVAVALFCAGDADAFVDRMNETAAELGMADTHFANPNGLDHPDHYSTAYDLALLARAVLENEALAQIAAAKWVTVGARSLTNHNKLLWRYGGCVGLKTGYTDEAGRTLVSAARRDGVTLICVTLRDPDDWADHAALFDYGFSRYHIQTLAPSGRPLALVPVSGSLLPAVPALPAAPVTALLAEGETVTARTQLLPRLEAPVAEGQVVGRVTYLCGGVPVAAADLVAARSAPAHRPGRRRDLLGAVLGAKLRAKGG